LTEQVHRSINRKKQQDFNQLAIHHERYGKPDRTSALATRQRSPNLPMLWKNRPFLLVLPLWIPDLPGLHE